MSKTTSGLPPLSEGGSHATTITDWSWNIIDTFLGADGGAENNINELKKNVQMCDAVLPSKKQQNYCLEDFLSFISLY